MSAQHPQSCSPAESHTKTRKASNPKATQQHVCPIKRTHPEDAQQESQNSADDGWTVVPSAKKKRKLNTGSNSGTLIQSVERCQEVIKEITRLV